MQRQIRYFFADLFAAHDSDPTGGQNTRDRLLPSHAGEILTAARFIEKLKVKDVEKMAKKGKRQRQETRLPARKSKRTRAIGVADRSEEDDSFVAVAVSHTTKTQRKIKRDG